MRNSKKTDGVPLKKTSQFKKILKVFLKNRGAVIGLIIFAAIVVLAILAKQIAPYDYAKLNSSALLLSPCKEHIFGTDDLGRDIFSRIIFGARYSLAIGLSATLMAVVVGVAIGSICGYYGGVVDDLVMRAIDVIQALPGMLLAIVISAVLGTGIFETILALAISNVSNYARIIRGSILSIRKMEYLDAATVDNASAAKIILKHLIPNAISPIIVQASMGTANVIMTASMLSFIGLGVRPPDPEWGAMLSEARNYIRNYPHTVVFPGLAIMSTVLSLNLLGDGLRDALDPKLKR